MEMMIFGLILMRPIKESFQQRNFRWTRPDDLILSFFLSILKSLMLSYYVNRTSDESLI
jgi:hypothetical protein